MDKQLKTKVYWKGLEELAQDPNFLKNAEKEFSNQLPIKDVFGDNSGSGTPETSRRDFLKLMGFGVAAVTLASCETPVRHAIPYLNKPEEIDPGIPNYYASVFTENGEFCPVLVKTREGRPIFVEGNTNSFMTRGKTNARVNTSVLSLYDLEKSKNPTKKRQKIDWETLDKEISQQLETLNQTGKPFVIVCNTLLSPSTQKLITDFKSRYPNTEVVTYDPESFYSIKKAHQITHNQNSIPSYAFDQAKTIVSFNADFLGGWLSSIEHTVQYAKTRKVGKDKKDMSQHFQFETMLTITGAKADFRTPIKPSQEGLIIGKLYNLLAQYVGAKTLEIKDINVPNLEKAAQKLLASKGQSLVVSGTNDVNIQILINRINEILTNYGSTIDLKKSSFQKQGNDEKFVNFVERLKNKEIGGVLFYNANPIYNHTLKNDLVEALQNVDLTISTSDRLDETASLCTYHAPDSHYLESWNDAEAKPGLFALCQPTISPIFETRQVQQSLLNWAGIKSNYYDFLKSFWKENIHPLQKEASDFDYFWKKSLHDGLIELEVPEGYVSLNQELISNDSQEIFDMTLIAKKLNQFYKPDSESIELYIYSNSLIGTGEAANNPILQETPDPITRVCWGNYVAVSQKMGKDLGVKVVETTTQMAKVTVGDTSIELPILVQPGLANNTIAIKMGYGRNHEQAGKVAEEADGVNAFAFTELQNNTIINRSSKNINIENTGRSLDIAQTQTHHTIMERESIVQETTLAAYQSNPEAGRFKPHVVAGGRPKSTKDVSIWGLGNEKEQKAQSSENWLASHPEEAQRHVYANHHWAMVVDLNSCTGCGACVSACSLENNVPVVGKQEVINRREMHWMRIDRYYSSTENAASFSEMEKATENPEVVFQPMMCQHCNNAPCETVCPVAATTHSSEGLNQMTYNRCVGTKYCANNCPYKVRRFNWFKYHTNDEFDYHLNNYLGKMVLNPDVTVRSRGVMEKCSMCVQRIQAGKLNARLEKRKVKDGEVTTACSSACPSDALTFGDINDPKSQVRTLMEQEIEGRAYHVLDEIATKPNVWYLTKVRNKA